MDKGPSNLMESDIGTFDVASDIRLKREESEIIIKLFTDIQYLSSESLKKCAGQDILAHIHVCVYVSVFRVQFMQQLSIDEDIYQIYAKILSHGPWGESLYFLQ
jgi:hypothetical protein